MGSMEQFLDALIQKFVVGSRGRDVVVGDRSLIDGGGGA